MSLNITDIIRIHALGNAGCLPICPLFQVHDAMELQSNLCVTSVAQQWSMPQYGQPRKEKLAYRSLLRSVLQHAGLETSVRLPSWRSLQKGNSETRGTLMCSSTLSRETVATTSSLFQIAFSDICSREKYEAEFHLVHAAWGQAADRGGNPRPQMHWLVD